MSKADYNKTKQNDIYQAITDKIIGLLESVSADEWQAPFANLAAQGLPYNPVTENYYQGINIPCLWFIQSERQYNCNEFATFKQWQSINARVKKGEKGSTIVFYKTLLKEQENDQGEGELSKIPMLKLYTVFNVCQVDGYTHTERSHPNEHDLVERLELADQFCANTKADIRHISGNQAYYHRKEDYIHIPETMDFIMTQDTTATEGYYSTLFHELVHWSGAPHRLNRDKAKSAVEKWKYSREELVAELGSAFLCSQFNILQSPYNHARYIKGWLQALRNDKKFIAQAAADAGRSVDYLNNLQPQF